MSAHDDSFLKGLAICVAFFAAWMPEDAARAEVPDDRSAQESGRVARVQEHRDAEAFVALAEEYQARWRRGERGEHILKALDRLAMTVGTWEWDDFGKQIELPRRIGLFVLENAPADIPLEIQVDMALCVCDTLDQHAPSFTAAERKRRALLASQVLQRVLAKIDSTVDLSARVWLNVPVPEGVVDSGSSPSAIKDPALRAEYERRIRDNALLIRKRNEQFGVLRLQKRLLLPFERYLTSVYSSHPEAGPELDQILTKLRQNAKGKSPDLDVMVERVTQVVRASQTATRPG